jgi:vitamin K-dependent gamma-carboxylase
MISHLSVRLYQSIHIFYQMLFQEKSYLGLLYFRIVFGLLGLIAMMRLLLSNWLEDFLIKPQYTFKHLLFDFLSVPSSDILYTIAILTLISTIGIVFGYFYRISMVIFCLGFSAIHLMDITNYLNHYYLVSLISFIMIFLPLDRKEITSIPIYQGYYVILRFQLAMLYCYAGVAKINTDWLFYAQPLKIWLKARTSTPMIGWLFEYDFMPYVMSWAGCLYDLTIVFWLSWQITRKYAYVLVIVFHLMTHLLFQIGMFPWIMIFLTPIFFDAHWPILSKFFKKTPIQKQSIPTNKPIKLLIHLLIFAYVLLQICLPLRTFLYGGNVLWHEQGMRFSWRVMLREKNGDLSYLISSASKPNQKWEVNPKDYLTWRQVVEMSSQPDMIVDFAKYLSTIAKQKGIHDPIIRVDSMVSLNGRKPQRMINPNVDLLHLPSDFNQWILPAPTDPPR